MARLYPAPLDNGGYLMPDVLELYRQIVRKYGPVPRAEAGIGRCLSCFGLFGEAAKAFVLAGPRYEAERLRSDECAQMARLLDRSGGRTRIVRLAPIPDSSLWIAISGRKTDAPGWMAGLYGTPVVYRDVSVVLIKRTKTGRGLSIVGRPVSLPVSESADKTLDLYILRASLKSQQRLADVVSNPANVNGLSPVHQFFRISGRGLAPAGAFYTPDDMPIQQASNGHGLTVAAYPSYLIQWRDQFEWVGNGFQFANPRHPELYPVGHWIKRETTDEQFYRGWMVRAATFDIHRQFELARRAWRRSLKACEKTIRNVQRTDSSDRFSGAYGDIYTDRLEILQRLAWLKAHDYSHRLLYCPHGFRTESTVSHGSGS